MFLKLCGMNCVEVKWIIMHTVVVLGRCLAGGSKVNAVHHGWLFILEVWTSLQSLPHT